ncbi:MAG: Dabb family protein, partial [Oceanospirillales bacterium]|nr:Dabb family protein [Oceanospirillales bacterium]
VRLNDKLDEVDVVVYAEFGSDDALLQFKAHPLYQESIERERPNRELRLVADTRP